MKSTTDEGVERFAVKPSPEDGHIYQEWRYNDPSPDHHSSSKVPATLNFNLSHLGVERVSLKTSKGSSEPTTSERWYADSYLGKFS